MTGTELRRGGEALAGIALVSLACFASVEPTNFSGFDEWLDIDLASRGILSMPYQNRPLNLLLFVPGVLPASLGLAGLWAAQWLYLTTTGLLSFVLVRRVGGAPAPLAFIAGVLAAVWAPGDTLRLDVVLGRGYAGATAATLFVLLLLAESCRARRRAGLLLACALAVLTALAYEAALPLLALGSLLPWVVGADSRSRRVWTAAFGGCVLLTGLWVGWALRPGAMPSYQSSALGFDPQPLRVSARLAHLAYDHIVPAVAVDVSEIVSPWSAVAGGAFLLAWSFVRRSPRDADGAGTRRAQGLALAGAAAAAAGYAAFALSPSIPGPERTQFLAGPGIGLLLAGLLWVAAAALPLRLRPWLVAACGTWLVAVAAGRTAAMQQDWREASYWRVQNDSLVALTTLVPMTKPNTLLVLIDERGAWPANFTFRHAIQHLYGDVARGYVPGAHEAFLYPGRFLSDGFHYLPWPVIREPWDAPATRHGYDEMVVLRLSPRGQLTLLAEWPAGVLPGLPAGARYEPLHRIVRDAPLPSSRAILRRP